MEGCSKDASRKEASGMVALASLGSPHAVVAEQGLGGGGAGDREGRESVVTSALGSCYTHYTRPHLILLQPARFCSLRDT